MRATTSLLALSALLSPLYALSILSPFPGSSIDPTQPITVSWTSSASDPKTFDLKIDNSDPNSLSTNQVIASGVSTSTDSFIIPANTIQNFGTNYQIQAVSSGGSVLASAGSLTLGAGSDSVSTASNGQISFVSSTTATATATPTSGSDGSAGATATTTATDASFSFGSAAATGGTTILSGTVTAESTSATASSTKSSGFVTSSTTRTGTSTSEASAAATSAANTNTANGLGRMRSGGEMVMGAAGVLAGIVALIV